MFKLRCWNDKVQCNRNLVKNYFREKTCLTLFQRNTKTCYWCTRNIFCVFFVGAHKPGASINLFHAVTAKRSRIMKYRVICYSVCFVLRSLKLVASNFCIKYWYAFLFPGEKRIVCLTNCKRIPVSHAWLTTLTGKSFPWYIFGCLVLKLIKFHDTIAVLHYSIIVDTFPLYLLRIFPKYVKAASFQCGNVKAISYGGLILPTTHLLQ